MKRRVELLLASILVFGAQRGICATLEKVAVEGDPSPDMGAYRRKFRQPAVSDAVGQHVAGSARIFANRTCLVKFDPGPGADSLIVCRKDLSPEGHEFGTLGDPTINVAGDAAYTAKLTAGRSGVFRGGTSIVALTGDPSPAGPGFFKKFSSTALITDAGDVVFEAFISGGAVVGGVSIDRGYFRCGGGDGNCSTGGTGTIETLVLKNDLVPDRPGRKLCDLKAVGASIFGTAFLAPTKLDCASAMETPLLGVFRKPFGGAITTLALQGEPSNPVLPPGGTTYANLVGAPAISSTGIVAFRGFTAGLLTHDILYLCDPATCPVSPAQVAVEEGDSDGMTSFFVRLSTPAISDVADIAFEARVNDGQRASGIYIRRAAGGTIDTVARTNDVAPSISPTTQFSTFNAPSMSPSGKVAFHTRLRPLGSSSIPHEGIFLFE